MAGNVKQAETEWEEAQKRLHPTEAQPGYAPAREQRARSNEIEAFGTDTRRQELLTAKRNGSGPVPGREDHTMRAEQNERP